MDNNVRRFVQCSAILGVLVEVQVVECELSESSGFQVCWYKDTIFLRSSGQLLLPWL